MEIKFKRDTSFRKQFFVPDSFAHPAKMDAQLLIWIVENYTKKWETILDPMAGSGTAMLACGLSRNVILVELEEKFCKMMWDNWAKVRMWPQLGHRMGTCDIIQGDARQLEGLLVDKCIFSPPYAEVSQKKEFNTEAELDEFAKKNVLFERGRSPEAIKRLIKKSWAGYPDNPSNIGNLPYGSIDKIVTSPPYAEQATKGGDAKGMPREDTRLATAYSDNPDNLGNLPYGNIDAVVTSPPYERSLHETGSEEYKKKMADYAEKHLGGASRTSLIMQHSGEQKSPNNIGNLKSQSYLEAMLQVYAQCWGVLKDGGLMILVTKNFIRNKQIVRLDTDTIKLCEQAGFSFLERHYRKLPSQSFWRVIYHQKHPEVEQINYEDVLVFKKMELKV